MHWLDPHQVIMNAPRLTSRNRIRRGNSLLMSLFVMGFSAIVLVGLLQSLQLQVAEQRATVLYERANYLAGAAVHHALAELEANIQWRDGVPVTAFAPGSADTYRATITENEQGAVTVIGYGTTQGITRTLQVTID